MTRQDQIDARLRERTAVALVNQQQADAIVRGDGRHARAAALAVPDGAGIVTQHQTYSFSGVD